MATLDWIVIGLFALGLIGIIVWVFMQKQKSSGDYFLAGCGIHVGRRPSGGRRARARG